MEELKNLKVGEKIQLPPPSIKGEMSVEEAIFQRRSVRNFKAETLSLVEISQLLWAGQGITYAREGFRAAPSAGATYPLEVYLLFAEGIFRYLPDNHSLEKTNPENRLLDLAEACFDQDWVARAAINIVISAVFERTTTRYRQRGIGYVYMEVGHCAGNIHLQAVALGLGSVPVGAFDDDAVAKVVGLPAKSKPLYIVSVGYPYPEKH